MHTGSHKLNNALGQALLARRMGKPRIIAETGAGQHGVATATACALLDLECVVYMGAEDIRRQQPNVQRMELLGARGRAGRGRGADAQGGGLRGDPRLGHERRDDALHASARRSARRRTRRSSATCSASIGDEARAQLLERAGRLPDRVDRLRRRRLERDRHVRRRSSTTPASRSSASRPAGEGLETGRHGAPLTVGGRPGVLHGSLIAIMQDDEGQITEAHSISAGLDYPGAGPEHAWLRDTGRARYVAVDDERGARRVPPRRPPRGHHPGARDRPRAALRAARAGASRTLDLVCLLGPRRQGPRRGARAHAADRRERDRGRRRRRADRRRVRAARGQARAR